MSVISFAALFCFHIPLSELQQSAALQSVRPASLAEDEFIGQREIKEKLAIYIAAAKKPSPVWLRTWLMELLLAAREGWTPPTSRARWSSSASPTRS